MFKIIILLQQILQPVLLDIVEHFLLRTVPLCSVFPEHFEEVIISIRVYPFSTYAKFCQKLTFLTCVCLSGLRNVSFSEKFSYVLNGWSLRQIKIATWQWRYRFIKYYYSFSMYLHVITKVLVFLNEDKRKSPRTNQLFPNHSLFYEINFNTCRKKTIEKIFTE